MSQANNIIPHKKYHILASHSGKAIDVYGGYKSSCANLIQFGFHGNENQQFIFEPTDNGYFMIKCVHSNLYWDIYGNRRNDCTTLIQFPKHGQHNQQFRLDTRGNGLYAIIARHSQKAIDITGGSHNDRVNVIQFQFHGQSNQLFRIQLTQGEQDAIAEGRRKREQEQALARQKAEYERKIETERQQRIAEEKKRQEEQRLREQIRQQMITQQRTSLNAQKNQLMTHKSYVVHNEFNSLNQELVVLEQKMVVEEKEIMAFAVERKDSSKKILILIGKTGDGKSSWANRIIGDKSLLANEGRFATSVNGDSCTQILQKYTHNNLCVVDCPGWDDTKGIDRTHTNNLCAFLKGCNGVNAFVVVRNGTQFRFDAHFQTQLKLYADAFGNGFWKHLIIVCTFIEEGIVEQQFIRANKQKEIRDNIGKLCNGINNNVPVIAIGLGNYRNKVSTFINSIPNKRYHCKNIKSPIDEYKQKKKELSIKKNSVQSKINQIQNEINIIDGKLRSL